jgi:hypothetical protein
MSGVKIAICHCYTKNTFERKHRAKATIRKFLMVRMVPLLVGGEFSMRGMEKKEVVAPLLGF